MLGINILFEEAICALVELFLNMMSGGHQAGHEMKYWEHTLPDKIAFV